MIEQFSCSNPSCGNNASKNFCLSITMREPGHSLVFSATWIFYYCSQGCLDEAGRKQASILRRDQN